MQVVLAFFDNKGMVYTNHIPRSKTVNNSYIIKALHAFQKVLKEKIPVLCAGEQSFQRDNAPSQPACAVREFLAQKSIQMIYYPSCSPHLVKADFF
jgi:hypothetical protein